MTIKDIARESGYAISTVSRALNNHPDVSEEAKKAIEQVVKKYKFVPNSNAKQLKRQTSRDIVIIPKGSFNLFFANIIEEMQFRIAKYGYNAQVHFINEQENEIAVARQICKEKKPVGIVFLGANIELFKTSFKYIDVPCIISTTPGMQTDYNNLSSVASNDEVGAREAITHLLENGHKKIVILSGDFRCSYASQLRLQGCMQALEENGTEVPKDNIIISDFSLSSSYNKMKSILESGADFTAVFAMSDIMAIGASRAIMEKGLKIPEDISIVGYDGIELSAYLYPKLTTIVQPQLDIAKKTIELLVSNIKGVGKKAHILLDIRLEKGETVKDISVR